MRILFISRAYPPVVGGMENQNYELSVWLARVTKVQTIANRRGKKFLPFFFPYALWCALFSTRRYDVLLLGDGVLACIGWCVKLIFPKKTVVSVVHGMDLTFKNSVYQNFWVKKFLPSLDGLIAVSNETIRAGVARGIPEEKFTFIPNGVDTEKFFAPASPSLGGPASRLSGTHTREELEKILDIHLGNKSVLLTSGRLAKRKGVAWFISNVLPKLPEDILYVVAGDGKDRENIKRAIQETASSDRVKLLGYVSDETREILFNTADIFIQPNIQVAGDMEGFGISVIEAASCALPVIASRLEGLQDAIKDGANGYLVETENAQQYASLITELLNDKPRLKDFGKQARLYVIDHYAWESIAQLYINALEKISGMRHN
jgi:glycosyltransferase involved in cell wall biosynthesis